MAIANRTFRFSTLKRRVLTAVPLIVGAALLCNWLIAPHMEYRSLLISLQNVMGRMGNELATVHETLEERQTRLRTMRSELEELHQGLFTPAESGLFAHDLQILAEQEGCTMVAVDLTEEDEASAAAETATPAAVRTFRADVVTTGRYEQIVALLRVLQERRPRVQVNSCGVDVLDPEQGRVEFRGVLTIHAAL